MGFGEKGFLGQVETVQGRGEVPPVGQCLLGGEPWRCSHTVNGALAQSLLKLSLLSDFLVGPGSWERKQVVLPRFRSNPLALTVCLVGHAWWG